MSLDDLRQELSEMRKLKMMSEAVHHRALRYIEDNESEVQEYLRSMRISDAADLVLDHVRACAGGRCE